MITGMGCAPFRFFMLVGNILSNARKHLDIFVRIVYTNIRF